MQPLKDRIAVVARATRGAGRGIACMLGAAGATAPNIMAKTGHALSAGGLAREYGFTDVDGQQPPAYCPEGMFEDGYFMKVTQ